MAAKSFIAKTTKRTIEDLLRGSNVKGATVTQEKGGYCRIVGNNTTISSAKKALKAANILLN